MNNIRFGIKQHIIIFAITNNSLLLITYSVESQNVIIETNINISIYPIVSLAYSKYDLLKSFL